MTIMPPNRCSTFALWLLFLALVVPFFVSCTDEDTVSSPPTPVLTIEEIPEALPAGIDLYFPIIVEVEHFELWNIDSVGCEISGPEGQPDTTFYLFDDGSAFDHPPGSDLLGVRSGDNVPGDGRFTRQITGLGFEDNYATYVLTFTLPGAETVVDSIFPPPLPVLTIEDIPEALPALFDLFVPIVIKVEHALWWRIDSVACEMSDPGGQPYLNFHLYDDGSALDHLPESDFLSLRSGDNVPGDGRFTRQVNARNFEGEFGTYLFRFQTPDSLGGAEDSVEIRPVEVPYFMDVIPMVTHFPVGFEPLEFQANIHKDMVVDRIDSVYLEIRRASSTLRRIHFTPSSGDTVWSLMLSPSDFWAIPTGDSYEFRFMLWDRFGLSDDTSQQDITIENGPPIVFNSTLPDTIWRPRPGEPIVTTFVTVQADDPESLLDIAEVLFDVHREGLPWGHTPDFYLCDEGDNCEFGDEVAGDGIYSVTLATDSSATLKDNLYYFRFYAIDKTHQQSEYLEDSVRVIERPDTIPPSQATPKHMAPGVF